MVGSVIITLKLTNLLLSKPAKDPPAGPTASNIFYTRTAGARWNVWV